jgi:hypothetical protein
VVAFWESMDKSVVPKECLSAKRVGHGAASQPWILAGIEASERCSRLFSYYRHVRKIAGDACAPAI